MKDDSVIEKRDNQRLEQRMRMREQSNGNNKTKVAFGDSIVAATKPREMQALAIKPKEYKDDLNFLNMQTPQQIKELMPMFKSPGRETIKTNKRMMEVGKWEPAVGTYHPRTKLTNINK